MSQTCRVLWLRFEVDAAPHRHGDWPEAAAQQRMVWVKTHQNPLPLGEISKSLVNGCSSYKKYIFICISKWLKHTSTAWHFMNLHDMCWQCKLFQSPANCDIAHICSPYEDVHFADNSTVTRGIWGIWGPKRGAMFPIDMALATDLAKCHRLPWRHGAMASGSQFPVGWPAEAKGPAEDVICDTLSTADMTRHGEPRSQART